MNNGKICVSLCAETADELIEKVSRVPETADMIEVRFDCLPPDQIGRAFELIAGLSISKPMIATYRPAEQGGRRAISLEERTKFWQTERGPLWIADLEEDVAAEGKWNNRIASFHDFSGNTVEAGSVFERLSSTGADTIKIAFNAKDITDTIPVWKLLEGQHADNQVIPIAMGEAGKFTRILGMAHGASMTYAAPDSASSTAAGQLTLSDLQNVYRVKELDRETKVYGVIGDPVSGSLSPFIHNRAFAAAGINAVFVHLEVKDLDAFIRRMVRNDTREAELNFAGFSVTMPHKQAIIRHLDHVDPTAEKIGAVNTVNIDGDKLTGYNTDAFGFISTLGSNFGDLKGARAAVVGAGGAARACVYALKDKGADVTVFARNEEKAKVLADKFGARSSSLSNKVDEDAENLFEDMDILVNATPLGMKGPHAAESPFRSGQLAGVKFVYDLVTRADDTPLVMEAKKAGVPVMGGLDMLIAQAGKQFEIWTGGAAPLGVMREAALNKIKETHR